MRIGDFTSLGIRRDLANSQKTISRALERLSSGRRINSPRDDLASFARANELEADVRGLRQATLNINQGIGFLETATSAIDTQTDIVQRMREIAVQASNGLLSESDRTQLNKELTALRDEFQRISQTTNFAGLDLLSSDQDLEIQIGSGANDQIDLNLNATQASDVFTQTVGTGSFSLSDGADGLDIQGATPMDFDGDGDLDLIKVDFVEDEIDIFENDGSGNFSFKTSFDVQVGGAVRVGDFNGDGLDDITMFDSTDLEYDVYLNQGNGSFGFDQSLRGPSDSTLSGVSTIADTNDDGFDDIVGFDANNNIFVTFFGSSAGDFEFAEALASPIVPNQVISGDFNGDNIVDLLMSNVSDNYVLFGNGDGSFTEASSFSNNGHLLSIADDVDNDGDLDLIGSAGLSTAEIYLNDGSGNFSFASTINFSAGQHAILDSGDLNGDGNVDLVTFEVFTNTGLAFILLGDGQGNFTEGGTLSGSVQALEDINGDGVDDLLVQDGVSDFDIYQTITKEVSALSELSVLSQDQAQRAIEILDSSLESLLARSAQLSTQRNRLSSIFDSSLLMYETKAEALDQLVSADFAQETADLVAAQIQQQAQLAALVQANSQLQIVLGLLPE